jgi:hypothetical protein
VENRTKQADAAIDGLVSPAGTIMEENPEMQADEKCRLKGSTQHAT